MDIVDAISGPNAERIILFVGELEKIARNHLKRVQLDEYERSAIEEAANKVDPAFRKLILDVLRPFGGDDPERMELGFARIYELVYACAFIAGHVTWTDGLEGLLKKSAKDEQAGKARAARAEKARTNFEVRREAIMDAAKGVPLERTRKFAESIHKDVCKYLKKKRIKGSNGKMSAQTIERVIRAILKE